MSTALALDLVTLKLVGFDLAAYILAARRVLFGEPLYQTGLTALGPFGQYVYPPFVVVPFLPIAMVPFDVVRGVGLLLLSVLAAVLMWDLVSALPRSSRYWGAAAMVLFFPLIWEITLENLTLVTLGLCVLAWRIRGRARWSGTALAVGLGLKLLPLSLIAYFAAARRWRVLTWSAVACAAIVVATWPFVGGEWSAFRDLIALLANAAPGTGSNVIPVIFAAPALRLVLPALAVAIALVCGVISLARDGREEESFRIALAAVPLVASTLWYPYLVLALPLLIFHGPRPPTQPLRLVFSVARPLSWTLMQWEGLSDPGREFVLPLVGLLLLLAVGLLETRWIERASVVPRHARSQPSELAHA